MRPDWQLDLERPVRFDPVQIAHAGILRHDEVHRFSHLPCHVQKDLPAREVGAGTEQEACAHLPQTACGIVGTRVRMPAEKPLSFERCAQPVNRLLR